MITTKVIKKEKKLPFPIYPINWGVSKYGVSLFVNHSAPLFLDGASLDVEDDEQGNFVGIGIYDPFSKNCYYWSDWELAKQLVIPKFIAHNGVSDLRKLQKWGFKIDESWLIWDTQLVAHILDSTRKAYGLKKLVKEDLGIEYPSYDDIVGKRTEKQIKPRITLDKQPLELVSEYNAMDCYTTHKLYEKQLSLFSVAGKTTKFYREDNYLRTLELPASFVFEAMESRGIRIDRPYLTALKASLEAQQEPIKAVIANELGPINLNSPKQLLEALHGKGIKPELKGKPTTDKRALERFSHLPIVSNLLSYSELSTLLSSFVSPYLERGEDVVHPHFNQCGTRTGRPSCSNPNLLQIPKRSANGKLVRKMFIPRDGCLFGDCDYSEGEPRMLAHLSEDPNMLELFAKNSGFHSYFAEKLAISRDRAKVFDLETYYRATKYGVARHLNCSLNEAQKLIDEAWQLFPTLYDWEQKVIYEAKRLGFITTLMGRRIKIENLDSNNEWIRTAAERQCMNNLAQASLQECMKAAMIQIHKSGIDILVQVYDEILFESPEECIASDLEIVKGHMTNTTQLSIPLTVDSGIGPNWAETK